MKCSRRCIDTFIINLRIILSVLRLLSQFKIKEKSERERPRRYLLPRSDKNKNWIVLLNYAKCENYFLLFFYRYPLIRFVLYLRYSLQTYNSHARISKRGTCRIKPAARSTANRLATTLTVKFLNSMKILKSWSATESLNYKQGPTSFLWYHQHLTDLANFMIPLSPF